MGRPISFPGRSSPSRTSGPWNRSESGRNTGARCGRLWAALGCANGGGQTCCRRTFFRGTERGSGEPLGRESEVSGRPRRPLPRSGPPRSLAALDEVLQLPERLRVDQVPDVPRQLAEKEDGLDLLHCGRLQGGEVVLHDEGPGVAAHRVVQPSTRHLGGAEAVGAQEEVLQLLVRVAEGGGVLGLQADNGDKRKQKFRQRSVELHERLRDLGCGEHHGTAGHGLIRHCPAMHTVYYTRT
jgi:hypothetical protein